MPTGTKMEKNGRKQNQRKGRILTAIQQLILLGPQNNFLFKAQATGLKLFHKSVTLQKYWLCVLCQENGLT